MAALVNPNSVVPLYKQILKILSDRIADGVWGPGEKLPPESALMQEFGVSRITVRAAIEELTDSGVLVRSQGKGTFVAAPKSTYKANDIIGFTRSCRLAGKVPTTKLIKAEWIYPTQADIDFLNIPEDRQIIYTERLRFVDGNPTLIEVNHCSPELSFLFDEDLDGSLFEILEKHGISIENRHRSLEICYATKDEANLLKVEKNKPLILFRDEQIDQNGKPLYLSKQVYNTDHMKFYF